MSESLTKTHTYTEADCVIRPGEGKTVDSGMVLKIRANDMDGYFSMMEGCLDPKQLLAPHTHQRETQAVYVIDGELEFEVGGEGGLRFTAGKGSYVIKPKGVEHCFWNASDRPVPYIELSTGQNFESFQLTTDQVNKVRVGRNADTQFEMKIHFERIPSLLRRHGLTSVSGMKTPGPVDAATVFDLLKPLMS
jgi:quercetin dioxygenase-like cupin family protein